MWHYTNAVKQICFSLAFNITIYFIIKRWIKPTGGNSYHRYFCELDRYVTDALYPNQYSYAIRSITIKGIINYSFRIHCFVLSEVE